MRRAGSEVFGVFTETNRGFERIAFEDAYGCACSLQQSSAIGDYAHSLDKPGSSFVWLGVDDGNPMIMKSDAERLGVPLPPGEVSGWMPYPLPPEVLVTTRMHLNREQVEGLVARLQQWLATGKFQAEQ